MPTASFATDPRLVVRCTLGALAAWAVFLAVHFALDPLLPPPNHHHWAALDPERALWKAGVSVIAAIAGGWTAARIAGTRPRLVAIATFSWLAAPILAYGEPSGLIWVALIVACAYLGAILRTGARARLGIESPRRP